LIHYHDRPLFQLSKRHSSLLFAGIVLLAFALNLPLLNRFPLREDEALYSYWARHLLDNDPWMLTVWPDKPPLYLWMQALVFQLFGATQATARLINIAATSATTALLAVTACRLWGGATGTPHSFGPVEERVNRPVQSADGGARTASTAQWSGIATALLYALNPFTISFAATAYTDPLLLFWGQLAFYLTLRHSYFGAGAALAAAIMTKQQGLLYIPLILAFTIASYNSRYQPIQQQNMAARIEWRRFILLLLGMATVAAPVLIWDSQRWAVAPSPWDLSVQNYGRLAMASPSTWLARAGEWRRLLWYFGGNWLGWTLYALLGVWAIFRCGQSTINQYASHSFEIAKKQANRAAQFQECGTRLANKNASHLYPLLIMVWSIGFLLLHFVTTIQIWDRYLLPLIPMLALLLGAAAGKSRPIYRYGGISSIALLFLLLPGAMHAARGGFPLGGDRGAYSGLTEAAGWLQQQQSAEPAALPLILYQQPLGWQLQFYLYDEAQARNIEVRWFANAVTLADNAAKSSAHQRYLLQPNWNSSSDLSLQLATRNLALVEVERFGPMALFTIENLARQPCSWCYCHATVETEAKQNRTQWQPLSLVRDREGAIESPALLPTMWCTANND